MTTMDKGKNAKCKQPRISIEYICKAKHRIEWNNLCLFAGKREDQNDETKFRRDSYSLNE